MTSTSINRIKGVELFKGCGRFALKQVDGLGTTIALRAGRTLCSQGEQGSEFFVLVDGVVDVLKPAERIARLHAGGWFGETALIHNVRRQASVTCATESTVIVFDRREFGSLCAATGLVRERVEHTAALYLSGEEPLTETWYEPACRRAATSYHRATTPSRSNFKTTDPAHRAVRMPEAAHLI